MQTRFEGPSSDRLYARLDALAGGTGGGGVTNGGANSAKLDSFHGDLVPVAFNTNTSTDAVNRDYAVPTYEALESSGGFSSSSVGYAGSASDGQQLLDTTHTLTQYDSAPSGHVAMTAGLRLGRDRSVDLALGFATTETQALRVAGTPPISRSSTRGRVTSASGSAMTRIFADLHHGSARRGAPVLPLGQRRQGERGQDLPRRDRGRVGIPWGQAIAANTIVNGKPHYFGSYREVFARDLYEAFTGLLVAGDLRTARAATRFLFEDQQQANGSMPRNSLENGKVAPDTGGIQLDETSYPILMDWQSGLAGDRRLYRDHVIPAADFVVAHGPTDDGVERWETGRLLAVDNRRRDRRPDGRRADRGRQPRLAPRRGLPGHGRRLRAQHQRLDGDHYRSVQRQSLLPAPEQDRRSERRDHLQPRQRRPARRRPAQRDRRRLPRIGAARCAAGERPGHPELGGRRRPGDRAQHQQRRRLLPYGTNPTESADGYVVGTGGAVGELGHCPVSSGLPCTCGRDGCLETVAAGWAIRAEASALLGRPVPDQASLAELEALQDPRIDDMLKRASAELGAATAWLVNLLDPSIVVFATTPFTAGAESFFEAFGASAREHAVSTGFTIVRGGSDARLRGTIQRALELLPEQLRPRRVVCA